MNHKIKPENQCKYFTNIESACCEKGVMYSNVIIGESGFLLHRIPCYGQVQNCMSYEAAGQSVHDSFDELEDIESIIIERINNHIEKTGNKTGLIVCPSCRDGMINFFQRENGIIQAICSTKNCVQIWDC